jgi:hypothetical protein
MPSEETEIPRFTLPSGRVVSLTAMDDSRRPWEIYYGQGGCQIARPRRGDSSRLEFYKEVTTSRPLVVDEIDALAIISILRTLRRRGPT